MDIILQGIGHFIAAVLFASVIAAGIIGHAKQESDKAKAFARLARDGK